jgi:chitodextrinase
MMTTERLRASWILLILVLAAIAWRPASAASVTYQHDPVTGRLTRATYSDGTIVNYQYDANGNRTNAIVTLPNDTTAPSRPAFLAGTAVSQTQINLQWGVSTDNLELGGYRLERCMGAGCTTFAQIAELSEATSYQDTGLSSNTTYVYRVRAFDSLNNLSAYSDNAIVPTPANAAPSAPGVPTFPTITMVSATVSWTAATDSDGTVTGYEYRVNAGSWTAVSGTTASLSNLAAWTDYTVQVRARDNSGHWGPASSATFKTLDTVAPTAPGTPSITEVTMTSAQATWANASDNGVIASYQYSLNNGASWLAVLPNPDGTPVTITISNLSAGTQYTLQVRAVDGAGNTGAIVSASFKTLDTTAPSVPEGLRLVSATSTTVNLAWNSASDNVGVTGYRVYRNGTLIGSPTTTTYPDNTTSGTTQYVYRVSARDAANNESAQSAALNVTTPDTIAPNTPTNLTASAASPTQINLSWTHATDSGGSGRAGYRIYRGGALIGTTAANTYSDTSVASNSTYSYTVMTYDAAGNTSGHSNSASATTPLPLQASVNSTTWSWFSQRGQPPRIYPTTINVTASGGSGSGYTYAWQYVSGDTATSVSSPTSNSTQWTRTISSYFTDYTSVWRCRVTDSVGNITYSPNVTVTLRAENQN